ncbi:MAG: glycosyltransferase family 4 protein [Chloroflexi bacterium]|nr:glycosyltransferase family 4 protein [Chloroflexota bacterium]
MRIMYLTRSDSVHDQRFMRTLAESEHEAFVWRLFSGDYPTPEGVTALEWQGIEGGLQAWNLPFAQRKLEQAIREVQPDLIHAGPLHDLAFLATKTGFANLLSMSWGFDLMKDVRIDKLTEHRTRFALQRSKGLITDAHCSAEVAVNLGFPREDICIFPWGVDLQHFSPANARKSGLAWRHEMGWEDKLVLLCLRSWEPNYGVDTLLAAFEKAAAEKQNLRLILLGDGSLHDEYFQVLEGESFKDKVFIGGRVPNRELIQFYGAADVYVTPSHVDGSSVSLMEALACGLPAIASDIPANLEWVYHNKNGWIFPDNDVNALRETILNCHPTAEIAEHARATAENKADWQKNRQILLDCYRQLLLNEGK